MTEQTETTASRDNSQPVRFGGWLILPAAGLALNSAILVSGLADQVASLALFSKVAKAGYGGLYSLNFVVYLGTLVFLIYTITRFVGKRRNAPSMMIAFMITNIATTGLLLAIGKGIGYAAHEIVKETAIGLVRSSIYAAIWIPYFLVSKRVKATFVN